MNGTAGRARSGVGGRPRAAGLTAIELAAVLTGAAIIAAIAIPTLHHRTLQARRAEATGGLIAIQGAEEQALLREGHYAPTLEAPPPAGLGLPARSAGGRYRFELEAGARSYTARARAQPDFAADEDPHCRLFTLDQNGRQGAADAAGADSSRDCWP